MKRIIVLFFYLILLDVNPVLCQSTNSFNEFPTWQDNFNINGFPSSEEWDITWQKADEHLTCYVKSKDNVQIKDSSLCLTLCKNAKGKWAYTSGRIVSKRTFSCGKLEFRAKFPISKGVWNAIWLWDKTGENCFGEVDILEHIGCWGKDKYQLNFHLWGTFGGKSHNHQQNPQYIKVNVSEYHIYTLEWYADRFVALVDGKEVCSFSKDKIKEWPFNKEFHLVIALAYGGNWAGSCGLNDEVLPQSLQVDWIKYYEFKK